MKTEEFMEHFKVFCSCVPPLNEEDLNLVDQNQALSLFDKWKIKRQIKRAIMKR